VRNAFTGADSAASRAMGCSMKRIEDFNRASRGSSPIRRHSAVTSPMS
jgi:hypothetical protein